jgi:hypothetical protein
MGPAGECTISGDCAVTPGDCALAVAIPLSLEALIDDWGRSDSEFARVIVRKAYESPSPEAAWRQGYSGLCDQLREEISTVRGLGVTVAEDARLADLGELFAKFKVVSILAHGPFPLLELDDVLAPQLLLNAFAPTDVGSAVQKHQLIKWLVGFPDVRNARSLEMLVRALRRLLDRSRSYFHRQIDEASAGDLPRAFELDAPSGGLTRMLLQEAIPGALRSPPVLELRDGLHSFDAFISKIPCAFSGTIEFVVCSALWFTEPLRRARPHCADILCPKQLAFIGTRCRFYSYAIRQLAFQPTRYAHAQWTIHYYLIALMHTGMYGSDAGEVSEAPEGVGQ